MASSKVRYKTLSSCLDYAYHIIYTYSNWSLIIILFNVNLVLFHTFLTFIRTRRVGFRSCPSQYCDGQQTVCIYRLRRGLFVLYYRLTANKVLKLVYYYSLTCKDLLSGDSFPFKFVIYTTAVNFYTYPGTVYLAGGDGTLDYNNDFHFKV